MKKTLAIIIYLITSNIAFSEIIFLDIDIRCSRVSKESYDHGETLQQCYEEEQKDYDLLVKVYPSIPEKIIEHCEPYGEWPQSYSLLKKCIHKELKKEELVGKFRY